MNQANAGQKSAPAQVMMAVTNSQIRAFFVNGGGLKSSAVVAGCGEGAATALTLSVATGESFTSHKESLKRGVGGKGRYCWGVAAF